jgi:di/tricarboxylate transporter
LERTGVVQWLADRLGQISGAAEPRMIAVFMSAGALLSLVMNNVAAGAVLLPAAVSVARQTNVRESRLLMPLAFGTLLGGMATLFTTANINISGSLQAQGQRGLTMLDFVPPVGDGGDRHGLYAADRSSAPAESRVGWARSAGAH